MGAGGRGWGMGGAGEILCDDGDSDEKLSDRLILCRGWTGFLWMDGCTALLEKQLRIIGHACHETEFWGR